MRAINFLPWREAIRQQRKKRGICCLFISGCLVFLCLFFLHQQTKKKLEQQVQRVQLLKQRALKIQEQMQAFHVLKQRQDRVFSLSAVLQTLQIQRQQVLSVLSELVDILPQAVYLTHMDYTAERVVLSGCAKSNIVLARLMTNFKHSTWVKEPKWLAMSRLTSGPCYEDNEFKLTFIIKNDKTVLYHAAH
jgi:type IV pilus assembly protein PilN